MSKPMKFCRDCRYFMRDSKHCFQPTLAGEPEPVMGIASHPSCAETRKAGGACGPEAKLFRDPIPYPPVVVPW